MLEPVTAFRRGVPHVVPLVAALLVVGACTGTPGRPAASGTGVGDSPDATAPTADTTSTEPGSTAPGSSDPEVGPDDTAGLPADDPCVAGDRPFSQEGPMEVVGEPDTDADLVSEVTWETLPACGQLVVSFVTAERAPAVDPPEVEPAFLRTTGVLRLTLSEAVSGSAIADQVVGTNLMGRVFVARAMGGHVQT